MKQSAIFIKKENLLSVLALIAVNTFSVGSASSIGLVNPSFEDNNVSTLPALFPGDGNYESTPPPRANPGFVITNQSNITGWRTTATDQGVEIWQSGFLGVSAAPGNGGQFAEVNGTQDSTLFQDLTIAASGGATQLYFNFWHRARENGGAVQTNAVNLTITDSAGGLVLFDRIFATQLNPNDINATNNGWANYTSASFAPFSAAAGASRTISFAFNAIEGTFVADQYQTTGAVPTSSSNFTVATTNANVQTGNFLDNANLSDDPTTVPFDFSPNLAIGVLGGLYLGRRVLKSLKKKKDID